MSDHISRTANYLRELTDSRHMAFSAIAEIICQPMLDRIEELEALVNSLDIECMHPSMDGRHQCSIRANGRALSVEQWDTIMDCRESGTS